jgi:hypothetical protein
MNQRWREGRSSFRPSEPIQTNQYEVDVMCHDRDARAFVVGHHYSRSYPAARFRYGVYRRGQLVGVAVFSHPTNDRVLTNVFPLPVSQCVELGRFVLLDEVPGNGETWFLARCFEQLRKSGICGVISFSDPVPRTDANGERIFIGHFGTIYQAHNATFLGRSTPRTLRILPDGTVLSDRTIQKIRAGEKGWHAAVELLRGYGAEDLTGDRRTWLTTTLSKLTRLLRHPGCFKYAWLIERSSKREVERAGLGLHSQPYPKPLMGVV